MRISAGCAYDDGMFQCKGNNKESNGNRFLKVRYVTWCVLGYLSTRKISCKRSQLDDIKVSGLRHSTVRFNHLLKHFVSLLKKALFYLEYSLELGDFF